MLERRTWFVLVITSLLGTAGVRAVPDSSSVFSLPDVESYNVENDFVKHLSKGWFPQPYRAEAFEFSGNFNYLEWDHLSSIRSAGFHPTTAGFSADNPFKDGEDDIKKKFRSTNAGDGFSSLGYDSYGAYYSRNLPWISSIVRMGLSYDVSRTRLYALDTTRQFLSEAGVPTRFKEVNVLYLSQHFVNLNASLMIPIYGIFLESEALNTSSFYFTSFGVQALVNVVDEATQYAQIANAKDQLRYSNGTDTLTSIKALPLSTTNVVRTYAEWTVGWRVSLRGIAIMTIEHYILVPLNDVLNDANWSQYRFGIRASFGIERP